MITSSSELRRQSVEYCLDNNLTANQVNNITSAQVEQYTDTYKRVITGTMLRTIKAECLAAIKNKTEDDRLAILTARLIANYPNVVCGRDEIKGFTRYSVWPNGKPEDNE